MAGNSPLKIRPRLVAVARRHRQLVGGVRWRRLTFGRLAFAFAGLPPEARGLAWFGYVAVALLLVASVAFQALSAELPSGLVVHPRGSDWQVPWAVALTSAAG